MTNGGRVKFHEDGRPYFWDKASRKVFDSEGLFVGNDCYNLQQARQAVGSRLALKRNEQSAPAGRCRKYKDELECIGHDCMDRVGTPCIHDKLALAGAEDLAGHSGIRCPNCDEEMEYSAPWRRGVNKWWCRHCGHEESRAV